jgi:putative transposase
MCWGQDASGVTFPKICRPAVRYSIISVSGHSPGVLEKIHQALYAKCREKAARKGEPTACIVDSQSVKSAEKGGGRIEPHGFDAGKIIKGKKRHILVATLGLRLHAIVHSAGVQAREGGLRLLSSLGKQFPLLAKIFADGA